MADRQIQAVFDTLNADLQRVTSVPPGKPLLTPDQRSLLVTFAEANVTVAGPADLRFEIGMGRVQALYVAGALATLDAGRGQNPFKDETLKTAYRDQQKYMQAQMKALEQNRDIDRDR